MLDKYAEIVKTQAPDKSSDFINASSKDCQAWKPTMNLRFLNSPADFLDGTRVNRLQQEWVSDSGELQWREINNIYE